MAARHEVDERGGRDQRDDDRKRDGASLGLRLACRGLFVEETAGLVALQVLHFIVCGCNFTHVNYTLVIRVVVK